jgi:hypothetical protein
VLPPPEGAPDRLTETGLCDAAKEPNSNDEHAYEACKYEKHRVQKAKKEQPRHKQDDGVVHSHLSPRSLYHGSIRAC